MFPLKEKEWYKILGFPKYKLVLKVTRIFHMVEKEVPLSCVPVSPCGQFASLRRGFYYPFSIRPASKTSWVTPAPKPGLLSANGARQQLLKWGVESKASQLQGDWSKKSPYTHITRVIWIHQLRVGRDLLPPRSVTNKMQCHFLHYQPRL